MAWSNVMKVPICYRNNILQVLILLYVSIDEITTDS